MGNIGSQRTLPRGWEDIKQDVGPAKVRRRLPFVGRKGCYRPLQAVFFDYPREISGKTAAMGS